MEPSSFHKTMASPETPKHRANTATLTAGSQPNPAGTATPPCSTNRCPGMDGSGCPRTSKRPAASAANCRQSKRTRAAWTAYSRNAASLVSNNPGCDSWVERTNRRDTGAGLFAGNAAGGNSACNQRFNGCQRNSGSRAGTDVVQVYIEPPQADAPRPVRELKAFTRIALAPGESKPVTLSIAKSDLAYWDPGTKAWVVTPGAYAARVGDSSRNLPLKTGFRIGN